MSQEIDSSVHSVMNSFSSFTQLTTLSILPPRCKNGDSLYMNIYTLEDCLRMASLFVRGIPAFTRVAVPPKYPANEALWYTKAQDVAQDGDILSRGSED